MWVLALADARIDTDPYCFFNPSSYAYLDVDWSWELRGANNYSMY